MEQAQRGQGLPCPGKVNGQPAERHIREECGVFGVFSPRRADVATLAYYGLYALQHRGQELSLIHI